MHKIFTYAVAFLIVFPIDGVIQSSYGCAYRNNRKTEQQKKSGDGYYISNYLTGPVKPAVRDSV